MLPFPVIEDKQAFYADQYGALKTPHAFVVLPNLHIVFAGGIDDSKTGLNPKKEYLRAALDDIAAGKIPEVTEVRTMGCRIER